MDKKITIAIDGFSSTGKSTLAKQLARHLGYAYVDTGAMYRAVTYYAMDKGYITDDHFDKQSLINDLPHISLQFLFSPDKGFAEMYINEHNVEKMIRTLAVSNKVSRVAEVSEVRAMLVKQQQQMGAGKGVVMDGRDIGTVVFPDAELKLFMTASPETRAKRRYVELQEKGDKASYEEVLKNVQERDYIDCNRQDSPLVKAADAIEIDNSELSIEEQFEKVMQLVQNAV
ncbi:(d)CMP kinase [Flavobacterium coralii]|uniref:(d)CMP kinase n=1 Tax=Flavobacterium coralii TaxID=2838017 RepID=UPI000C64907F|nr:cytidylate kinase [Flavobacterium sp.]